MAILTKIARVTVSMTTSPHIPVLLEEVISALLPDGQADRIVDGTLGAAGHTSALLERGAQSVLGLDRDPQALAIASEKLAVYGERAKILHSSYVDMHDAAAEVGWDTVDGILLDLGVSSMQLDTPERGFAFMYDAPLDMRFDPTDDEPPASELVNYFDPQELSLIFYKYGEDRNSRRIANAIAKARPINTTKELAAIIEKAVPRGKGDKIHPATRIFQALRIAVNDELGTLERTLPLAIDLLRPGGRLAVISFHSLEDRIVKQYFKEASTEIKSPPGMVLEEKDATVKLISRKPITATDAEIAQNPRSRSAKLRVVEKLA